MTITIASPLTPLHAIQTACTCAIARGREVEQLLRDGQGQGHLPMTRLLPPQALKSFRAGREKVLVATDVCARGMPPAANHDVHYLLRACVTTFPNSECRSERRRNRNTTGIGTATATATGMRRNESQGPCGAQVLTSQMWPWWSTTTCPTRSTTTCTVSGARGARAMTVAIHPI